MAKKKLTDVGSTLGYPTPISMGDELAPDMDNNPAGVIPIPNYSTDPSRGYPSENIGGTKRFSFTELVAKGESRADGDVNVNTANGVSSSKGQNKGAQYNYCEQQSGEWGDNQPFDGANITGT